MVNRIATTATPPSPAAIAAEVRKNGAFMLLERQDQALRHSRSQLQEQIRANSASLHSTGPAGASAQARGAELHAELAAVERRINSLRVDLAEHRRRHGEEVTARLRPVVARQAERGLHALSLLRQALADLAEVDRALLQNFAAEHRVGLGHLDLGAVEKTLRHHAAPALAAE